MAIEQTRRSASGVQLAEVVAAIALAADLGLGQPLEHVLRSCAIATRFAEHLGVSDEERATTYWVTLFVAAGCTGVSFELAKIFGDDIAFRADLGTVTSPLGFLQVALGRAGGDASIFKKTAVRAGLLATKMKTVEQAIFAHCAISTRLAEKVGLGDSVCSALEQSFARWDGKGLPRGLRGTDIVLPVRIVAIADTLEVLHRERGIDGAKAGLANLGGVLLDPSLVESCSAIAQDLIDAVDGDSSWGAIVALPPNRTLTDRELDDALELLADYADLKSPWFSGHSRGVASLAEGAARHAGLPEPDATSLRRAALLHDIGRNGVPNTIWDKAGPLTDDERERVRLHSYYTGRVLHRAGRLATLAQIGSAAHERANGGGYPRAIAGETIPALGRILECADVYVAMCEDRPHRPAPGKDAAAQELRRAARAGELDGTAVDAVLAAAGHVVRSRPSAPAGLTPREVEVLELAARGATTKQVASRLGITPKTAGNHIERIYTKIGVSSRAEAALFAMQNGLLRALES
jgi:HD-GYP domain-containing protein (c-di-GMP phosphodiesterase class II)